MGEPPRRDYDRAPLKVGLFGIAGVLLIAAIDIQIAKGGVLPEDGPEDFAAALMRRQELADAYETRLWIYTITCLGMLLAVARITWSRDPAVLRPLLADLGVIGVLWLIGGAIFVGTVGEGPVDVPFEPFGATAFILFAVAGFGTLGGSTSTPGAPHHQRVRVEPLALVGVGAAAASLLLGFAVLAASGDPCESDTPVWLDALYTLDVALVLGAVVLTIVLLAQRQWLAALVTLIGVPFGALVGVLANVCLT